MSVSYKAGFKKGKIPYNIKNIIGLMASIGPLNVAGDLIAGAGIASKTISLDGLSQSVATCSKAMAASASMRWRTLKPKAPAAASNQRPMLLVCGQLID